MNTKKALLLASTLVVFGLIGMCPTASRATGHMDGIIGSYSRTTLQGAVLYITKATIEKKQLIVEGVGFGEGAKLFVNGGRIKAAPDEMSPMTKLVVNKANKRLPVDEIVGLQVRNADGQVSPIQMFFTGLTLTYENTNSGFGVTIQAGRKFLLYFNDHNIIWDLYFPPSPPTVEFTENTQNIIFNSQGVFLANQAGATFFIMEGFPFGEPNIRHYVNLVVE